MTKAEAVERRGAALGRRPEVGAVLDDIGFYTLTESRAVGVPSRLERCELLVTDRCNFRCPYCRPARHGGDLSLAYAQRVVGLWTQDGLRNVRFSGGEPTLWPWLGELVGLAKAGGVERVAVSTNGSAPLGEYRRLCSLGVDDFSVSLDSCCASMGEKMSGGCGAWRRVVRNIRELSRISYVTVGVVLSSENLAEAGDIVEFAHGLGVADVRIITEAETRPELSALEVRDEVLAAHPILAYRVRNLRAGRVMRGLSDDAPRRCGLVLDDMAIAGERHYPCIIYLREGGEPIGMVGTEMRREREAWWRTHDVRQDPICARNCLDVCLDFNRKRACALESSWGPRADLVGAGGVGIAGAAGWDALKRSGRHGG